MKNNPFGLEACMRSVKFEIEELNGNPFEMLGRYTIRAKQDLFFNKTMITAVEKYIEDNGIEWNQM